MAIAKALRCNSRNKLPMSRTEKSEAAWRVVVGTNLTKGAIAAAASISERTVAYMRKAAKMIREAHPDRDLSALSWRDADALSKGLEIAERDINDEWIEVEAQKLADRLCKTFGDRLSVNPEVTARAIERYSTPLAEALGEILKPYVDDEDSDF